MSAPWTWKIKEMESGFYRLYRKHKLWPFWLKVQYDCDERRIYFDFPTISDVKFKINKLFDSWEREKARNTTKKIYFVEIIEKMDAS